MFEYQVLRQSTNLQITNIVNIAINEGWSLYGDLLIYVISDEELGDQEWYCQALTRGT